MVDFGGWLMPLQYKGIIQEHKIVRAGVGIFDVSHMGRIHVEGPEAEEFLDWLSTNRITGKKEGSAIYTVWCREEGTAVDDLLVYKKNKNHFFVVVNAANRVKDLQHMENEGGRFDIRIFDRFEEGGILAIQGPDSEVVVGKIFPETVDLKPFTFTSVQYDEEEVVFAATGYTGAGGYEILGSKEAIISLWDYFIQEGVAPIGLGARDTLRLEMGYALYGHELSDAIAPVESVSSWTVKMDKPQFLGKIAQERFCRRQYGVVLRGKGIAREGYRVLIQNEDAGYVTSGTMSPSLEKAIAIIMVDRELEEGEVVEIQIRNQKVGAEVVSLPFFKKQESKA